MRALDRIAEQDLTGALALLERAERIDPTYAPGRIERVWWEQFAPGLGPAAEAAGPGPGDPTSSEERCYRLVASLRYGLEVEAERSRARLGDGLTPSPCSAFAAAYLANRVRPKYRRAAGDVDPSEEALRMVPDSWVVWWLRSVALGRSGRWEEAAALLAEGAAERSHPVERLSLLCARANALLAMGDTAAARTLARNVAAASRRDGRPGVEVLRVTNSSALEGGTSAGGRNTPERVMALAASSPDPLWRWAIFAEAGTVAMDRLADPAAGLAAFQASLAEAEAAPARPLTRARSLLLTGRAEAKLGRLDEAEAHLRSSAAISATLDEPYWLAEAWHNLAHVYEGRGDSEAAAEAAQAFSEHAEPLEGVPIRIMSYHDLGLIRWKAGWHAAADSAFRRMISVVEEHDSNHYWAGEFFERKGDLGQALRYYRLGLESGMESTPNLAGLVRIHRALGDADSAAALARRHDAGLATLTAVPLLPGVLLEAGREAEALEAARTWAGSRVEHGNVEGAALALVSLADLALRARRPSEALDAASRARVFADSLHLQAPLVDALRLAGEAELLLGRPEAGISRLRAAVAEAEAHPSVGQIHDARLALAEALAARGRADAAMDSYDRAAAAVESVARTVELDLDRSRYRERHLAAFDGALRLLLRGEAATTATLDAVLAWIQRRVAAGLLLAGAEPAGEPLTLLGIQDIRRRLGPEEALVAYVVLDSLVAAVVVTPGAAFVEQLPARADSLRAWVDRLRRPMTATFGGRLDLARAAFRTDVSQRLYQVLLAPLWPRLREMKTLLVVSDGPLHLLPFEALAMGPATRPADPASVSFLLDSVDVAYLPSPRFLARDLEPLRNGDRLLLVALDAPGATREADLVGRSWKGPVTRLQGGAATEAGVIEAIPGHEVLHFATHATSDAADPLGSHLVLRPGDGEDGLFHLTEVQGIRGAGKLVVLGACQTFPGPLLQGEGPLGLARGFLAAGAREVVASQWPVGDRTADIMALFYDGLAQGGGPVAALQSAKRTLRSDPATSHPFHWAGLVIILGGGRPSP